MLIGVLGFQGSFAEHLTALRKAQIDCCLVRQKEDLERVNGLIIPGGESTTLGHLLEMYDLMESLKTKIQEKKIAVWGTCAGMILLAKKILNSKKGQAFISVLDITVARNAYGRQIESFEEAVEIKCLGGKAFPCIFIRAPKIVEVTPQVEVLGKLSDGEIVAVRQNNLLATSFHPELTKDTRFHEFFAKITKGS